MSLMFRVVRSEVDVHPDSGKLVHPVVPGTGKKKKQLDDGWKWCALNRVAYEARRELIMNKIKDRFNEHYK